MSPQPAIDSLVEALVEALAVLPAYEDPLLPVYEALGPERPLTLGAIRDHSRLLQDCAGRAHDQVDAIQRVIERCQRLPPTPLPNLPLGF
ncbi:MAG: hypothetical protein RRC07_11275 [Anaerolineae bacterium]|jgi:hypothetical protein|nr:hypothetical protein [Anaerolineae bacterium]